MHSHRNPAAQLLLESLLHCAEQAKKPSLVELQQGLGLSAADLSSLLGALDRGGWVDAERRRLTLSGLAVAVAGRAARRTRFAA